MIRPTHPHSPRREQSFRGRFVAFFLNPRNLYILGALIVLALSFSEVARGRQKNFMIKTGLIKKEMEHTIRLFMQKSCWSFIRLIIIY